MATSRSGYYHHSPVAGCRIAVPCCSLTVFCLLGLCTTNSWRGIGIMEISLCPINRLYWVTHSYDLDKDFQVT